MNDSMLLTERLNELAQLASDADNGFDRAAVYAAARAIESEFYASREQFDTYALEKVISACWHICAAVNYDITNDHESLQHVSWAHGEILTLKNVLERQNG